MNRSKGILTLQIIMLIIFLHPYKIVSKGPHAHNKSYYYYLLSKFTKYNYFDKNPMQHTFISQQDAT